jgi:PKD repeat protein
MKTLIVALLTLASGQVDWAFAQSPVEKIAYNCGPICIQNADGTGEIIYGPEGWNPSWSPDGSRIAYEWPVLVSNPPDVYVWNWQEGTITNLTNHPARDGSPTWSPDGRQIAFTSNRDGVTELYIMQADGSGVTRLTDNVGFDGEPAWSPDGARIAYRCYISGKADICAIDVVSRLVTQLTTDTAWDHDPAWSPDGARIAFATTRFPGTGDGVIAVMNADGSGARPLNDMWGQTPTWSPDGSRIAFVGFDPDDPCQCNDLAIIVLNADGTGLPYLFAFGYPGKPSWTLSTLALANPVSSFQYACTGPTCTFNGSGSSDPDGTITGYAWDFGDGTSGSGATASHTYRAAGNFRVTLTVTDNNALQGRSNVIVTVDNVPPIALFASACHGLTCIFDGSGSSDPVGTIVQYTWTFGDGTTGTGAMTNHFYAAGGSYAVTLTVKDNNGATATQTRGIIITPSIYVGDLDGASTSQGGTWTGVVTIRVQQEGDQGPVANALVSGAWSTGSSGSCTTNALGQCVVSQSGIAKRLKNVAFSVVNVAHATMSYDAAMNRDPDVDSTGTLIAVSRP